MRSPKEVVLAWVDAFNRHDARAAAVVKGRHPRRLVAPHLRTIWVKVPLQRHGADRQPRACSGGVAVAHCVEQPVQVSSSRLEAGFQYSPGLSIMTRVMLASVSQSAKASKSRFTAWWYALSAEPALQDLFVERERRFAWKAEERHVPIFDVHEAALRDAGFHEVSVIWQNMDNRVLMAVRWRIGISAPFKTGQKYSPFALPRIPKLNFRRVL